MKFRILIIFSFLFIPGIISAGQSDSNFSGGVDTSISQIISGGLWEHEGDYGRWRLIVKNLGWEHTKSFLYLQWLQSDDDKKEVVEVKTIPISEFNEGNWRNVVSIDYTDNSFVIFYAMRAEGGTRKAILIPDLPEKYKISF